MRRDYLGWYRLKSQLEQATMSREFYEQEIWWCSIGANIGFEEDGKHSNFERPVLVLRKYSKDLFFGIPLTSTIRRGKYYFEIHINKVPRSLILSQGRALSSARLRRRMYKINDPIFIQVTQSYIDIFSKAPKKTVPPR